MQDFAEIPLRMNGRCGFTDHEEKAYRFVTYVWDEVDEKWAESFTLGQKA